MRRERAGVGRQHQMLQSQGKKALGLDQALWLPAPPMRGRGLGESRGDVPCPGRAGNSEEVLLLLGGSEGEDPGATRAP